MTKRLIIIAALMLALAGVSWADIFDNKDIYKDANCNQAKYFPIGRLCADTDDGKLYKGTGAAVQEIGYYNPASVAITGGTGIFDSLSTAATKTSIFTHTAANYTPNTVTWTITGTGPLVHVAGNTTAVALTTSEATVAGATYRVTITGTGGGGTATWTLGGSSGTPIAASGSIAIENYITAATAGWLTITPASGCTVSITSITIERLTDGTGNATVSGNIIPLSQVLANSSSVNSVSGHRPQYSFYGDHTTGFGLTKNGNTPSIIAGGIPRIIVSSTYIQFTDLPLLFADSGGANPVYLYREAANIFALRNSTSPNTFRVYTSYTTAASYERFAINAAAGTIALAAETLDAGTDNINIMLKPAGTGGVGVSPPTEVAGGGFVTKVANAAATLSGASTSIAVNVPAGKRILSVQMRVNTAITSGDGATSWTAAYANTPTTAITSGQAFTKNTKYNAVHAAYELTTDVATITITPNSGTFSAGVIEAFVYYADNVALADAP